MPQKLKLLLSQLKQNSGSSIVTVVVTMFFVSILGSALLYMAYTGVLIKSTERRGVTNYYTATEYMDLIKAGFQEAVSEALAESYKDALESTGSSSAVAFDEQFLLQLFNWTPDDVSYVYMDQTQVVIPNFVETHTNVATPDTYTYNEEVIAGFLMKAGVAPEAIAINGINIFDPTKTAITINSPNGVSNIEANISIIEKDNIVSKISFNKVNVSYTDPETNVTTSVTSDIVVNVPDFNILTTEYDVSEIPQYSMIAKNQLDTTSTTNVVVDGSIYANNILLNPDSGMTFRDGQMITKESITIQNAKFTVDGTSADPALPYDEGVVWSNDIVVEAGSTFDLNGSAFVADDLTLSGGSSAATPATDVTFLGSYYGFGSSTVDALQSSSILINGLNTSIDLSQVSSLRIAGHSFITTSSNLSAGVLMGESVSVRPNQLSYLIPSNELTGVTSNPTVQSASAAVPNITVADAYLTKYQQYGMSIQQLAYNLPGDQVAIYYFYKFDDTDNSNEYFKDYFANNQDYISEYLEEYNYYTQVVANTLASGNILNYDPVLNEYHMNDSFQATITTDTTSDVYNSLTTILAASTPTTSIKDNPYENLVVTGMLSFHFNTYGVDRFLFMDPTAPNQNDAAVVAMISRTPVNVTQAFKNQYPNLKIILTYNGTNGSPKVTVNTNFEGLIISQGDISVNSTSAILTADEAAVEDAFDAIASPQVGVSIRFGDLLNIHIPGYTDQDLDTWDITDLVIYDDWSKENE